MSIFGKPDDRDQKIAALTAETEDDAELLANEQQLRAAAELRAAAMVKARDPSKMDEIALTAAGQIEDLFARGWEGGVTHRKASVQRLVRALIDDALTGGEPS
jgi:hypothetical protein